MLRVNIVAVGKLSQVFLRDGCAEYLKRISPYYRVLVTEIAEEKPRGEGAAETKRILSCEGERILGFLERQKGDAVALAAEGERLSSEQFSGLFSDAGVQGGAVVFVIGGSYGLAPEVKRRAARLISFSDMTFPHQMARLMLLEQIYRAAAIHVGIRYHK